MTFKKTNNKPHNFAKRHKSDFDLSKMLMIQDQSRFTKTPPFVLYDTVANFLKEIPANCNNIFNK